MEKKNTYCIGVQDSKPTIKVAVFKDKSFVDLSYPQGSFTLTDMDGEPLFPDGERNSVWRIKMKKSEPAEYQYFLKLRESESQSIIDREVQEYRKYGNDLSILDIGGEVKLDGQIINSNEKFIIIAGPFQSERDARHHSQKYGQLNHCRIHRELIRAGSGTVEVYDPAYELFMDAKNGIRLQPNNEDSYFELRHFKISHQDQRKAHKEDLHYKGELTVFIDENNMLAGINRISIDKYLKGVLTSELEEPVALEFAKSMAIVVRSQIFANLSYKHSGEPYDFCSEGHCLRYYGKTNDNEVIIQAVRETAGLVLGLDGNICDAHFSYSCGGHTENASDVWLSDEYQFASGKFDGREQDVLDLTKESNIKKWILTRPDSFCRQDNEPEEKATQVSQDAFRWDVFYTRNELENILYEKTGEEPGIIYEIIPVKRGISGRLSEVEILGSLKNVKIIGELNIRSAFSETFLNSSCFFIQPELDDDSVPISFLFVGAGKGHGIGLCKVGASKMAKDGMTCMQILEHYFESSQIKRIY